MIVALIVAAAAVAYAVSKHITVAQVKAELVKIEGEVLASQEVVKALSVVDRIKSLL